MSAEIPATTRAEAEPAPRAWPRLRSIAIPRTEILLVVLVFAVAIAPRITWALYNDRDPQGLNDPALYVLFGDQIADGKGYEHHNGEKTAYYPVGFPAVVGGLKKFGDFAGWDRGDSLPIRLMNSIFGAVTVVLLYALARRTVNRRTAIAAGLLLAFFPSQVFYSGAILSEAQFTMLLVASVLILAWNPWNREGMPYGQLFAAGLVLSAATMTRGITLVFPLLLFGIWFLYLHSGKRAALQTLVLFAGIAVLIVPWSIRNTLAFDTITGPSTNLGDDLCIGNYKGANGRFVLSGKCFEGYEGVVGEDLEIQRNRNGVKTGVTDFVQNPADWPRLIGLKAYWLLYNDDDGLWAVESYGHDYFISHPRREILTFAANGIYYATGLLTILGAAAFALSKDLRRLFILLTMLYILAVPLAFFGDPRFHYPAIPFAVVIAAATVIAFWDHRHSAVRPAEVAP